MHKTDMNHREDDLTTQGSPFRQPDPLYIFYKIDEIRVAG